MNFASVGPDAITNRSYRRRPVVSEIRRRIANSVHGMENQLPAASQASHLLLDHTFQRFEINITLDSRHFFHHPYKVEINYASRCFFPSQPRYTTGGHRRIHTSFLFLPPRRPFYSIDVVYLTRDSFFVDVVLASRSVTTFPPPKE